MRLINGYEHYYIDKCGNVYSDKSGKLLNYLHIYYIMVI